MQFSKFVLGLILFFNVTSNVSASPSTEARTFAPIDQTMQKLVKKNNASNLLLVLDVDNTLLAMNQPLGSDQWFSWQTDLLQTPTHEMEQVASSFTGLLGIQKELFEWGRMRPTDPNAPSLVKKWQELGIATLVLTSRGPELRNVTMRELKNNGYDFSRTAPQPRLKKPWLPTGAEKSLALSQKETRDFGLDTPRPVSYAKGVFLTAGQHKGAMLRILLHDLKLDEKFKAVVFVDDHKKHLTRMQKAFKPFPRIDLTTFHFVGEKPEVEKFKTTEKTKIHQEFETFQKKKKRK